MDPLNHLLAHFSLQAGVFHTSNICGVHDFQQDTVRRHLHLHLIQSGSVDLLGRGLDRMVITEPTLLFLPRPDTHVLAHHDGPAPAQARACRSSMWRLTWVTAAPVC